MAGIYAQKLPFNASNSTAVAAATAYQFNYPHIYGRDTIYGTTAALYSSHHHPINSRNPIHNRSNYIGIQPPEQTPFSYYVSSPVTYSGGIVGASGIGSPSLSMPTAVPVAVATRISRSSSSPPSPPNSSSSSSSPSSMRSGITHPHSAVNFLNTQHTHNDLSPLPLRVISDNKHHHQQQQQQNHHHYHNNNNNNNNHPLNLTDADENKHQSTTILSVPVISSSSSSNNKEQIKNFTTTTTTTAYTHENNSSLCESEGSFKIPSGKEGSLKHRILIRPQQQQQQNYEKDIKKSLITTSVVRSSNSSSAACSNFSKGAFIELANGILRKVEDMRTEDFLQSAEKSPYHLLINSTVVKIVSTSNNVTITFSYDKNRSKASVEVPQEHPFFVYGQGWASCNPELSLQIFGLNCQRLQVGDICISLTTRDDDGSNGNSCSNTTTFLNNANSTSSLSLSSYVKEEELVPQNLSSKSSSRSSMSSSSSTSSLSPSVINNFLTTNSTTAIGETAVTSRLITPTSVTHHLSTVIPTLSGLPTLHPYENHLHSYEINHSPSSSVSKHHHHLLPHHSTPLSLATSNDIISASNYRQHLLRQQQRYQHEQQFQQQKHQQEQEYQRCVLKNKLNDDLQMSPPSPSSSISAPSSRPPSNQTSAYCLVTDNDRKNKCSPPIMMAAVKRNENASSSVNDDNCSVDNGALNIYSGGCNDAAVNGNKNLSIAEEEPTNFSSDTLSRKRRWSAPDNICDDDCHQKSNKILIHS